MNPVSIETKIAVLRNIGFQMWSKKGIQDFENFWQEVMVSKYALPLKEVITFGLFAIMFIGRNPEYHPDLGHYYIFGLGPIGRWEVVPPVSKMSRTIPFSMYHAICLVEKPPDTFTEEIRVVEIVETGIVRGEYFEPTDVIFKNYCSTA
jgi:hypothetical protein